MRDFVPYILCCLFLCCAGCGPKTPSGPLFDVPSLVHKKIGEVEKVLGATKDVSASADGAQKVWRKEGHVLTIDYLKRNGRVTSLTLAVEDAANAIKDEAKPEFLKLAKLREGDPKYTLQWVEDTSQVFRFSGVRITPAPITYSVTLRVTGPQNLVGVEYAITGNSGENPTQNFLTMPKWEATLSATTGATIKLQAAPYSTPEMRATQVFKITVEILVNGKVMQSDSSEGGTAQCAFEL